VCDKDPAAYALIRSHAARPSLMASSQRNSGKIKRLAYWRYRSVDFRSNDASPYKQTLDVPDRKKKQKEP